MKFWLFAVVGFVLAVAIVAGDHYLLMGEMQAAVGLGLAMFGFFSLLFACIGSGPEAFQPFGNFWGGIWYGATMALLCVFVFYLPCKG